MIRKHNKLQVKKMENQEQMIEKSIKQQIIDKYKKLMKFEKKRKELDELIEYLKNLGFEYRYTNTELILESNSIRVCNNNLMFNTDELKLDIYIQLNTIDAENQYTSYTYKKYVAFKPFLKAHSIYYQNDDDCDECSTDYLIFDDYKHFMIQISHNVCDCCNNNS